MGRIHQVLSVSNSFYCYEKMSYEKINKVAYYVMWVGRGETSAVREWQEGRLWEPVAGCETSAWVWWEGGGEK